MSQDKEEEAGQAKKEEGQPLLLDNQQRETDKSNNASQATEEQPKRSQKLVSVTRFLRRNILNIILVLIYLTQAFYMRKQWEVMEDQLEEIRGSSEDTRILAQSAKQQASNLERLATAALAQVKELERGVEETRKLVIASQSAVSVTKGNFVKEQRPYIWVVKLWQPVLNVGQRVDWHVAYGNFGKSPAVAAVLHTQVVFGQDAHKKIRPDLFSSRRNAPNRKNIGTIIPPGDMTGYTTAESAEILSPDDLTFIRNNNAGIALLMYVEYFDTAGNEYHSEICFYRLKTGAITSCDLRNVIK
jgi:hypothetical protein